MDSTAVNHSWVNDGMFAQALMDAHGNIIVAFDSSILVPGQAGYGSPYAHGSQLADAAIAVGSVPKAFLDADAFVKRVEHDFGSTHHIFLEGHSLGGGEAEFVGNREHLSGITFGAPGTLTPQYGNPAAGQTFVNFVDHGDPVGNFGNHFGGVSHVGNPGNAWDLLAPPVALALHHTLHSYAADLHLFG
jgi:hypothetical protein